MQEDATTFVKSCEKCQRFAPMIRAPAEDLLPLTSPWPFAQWGLDIVGPMPKATGNRKFLLMATDYFTKWIEGEALAKITEPMVERFIWKNILTRFGVPYAFVSDNGTQFQKKFQAFCEKWKIRNYYSTPAYPQANGQAEAANKAVLDGIKKRLEKKKGKWPDELPIVLWAYRTTPRSSTGETPILWHSERRLLSHSKPGYQRSGQNSWKAEAMIKLYSCPSIWPKRNEKEHLFGWQAIRSS